MGEYLLDLNSEEKRLKIKIDGVAYALRDTDEFGIKDLTYFRVTGKKFESVEFNQLDETEAEKLAADIDTMLNMIVVDLPDPVRKKLSDWHKMRIIRVFCEVALESGGAPEAASAENQSTGES